MKRKPKFVLLSAAIAIAAVLSMIGPAMSQIEQPKYKIITQDDPIEIRLYEPMIVAEVTVSGAREPAIEDGFRIIADYIFGNNIAQNEIKMTAPVEQQQASKIAMTAPVEQQGDGNNWEVRFVIPSKYTLETLPKPVDGRVVIKEIPAKSFAAIRFSGRSSLSNITKHETALRDYFQQKGIEPIGLPKYAFYNPPFTLPFLRRNEVMFEIE